MGANWKATFAIAACAAVAGSSMVAAPARAEDSCSVMATMRAASVAAALKSLSPDILGKPADLWSQADFANLLNNATACDGKPEGMKYQVNAKYWHEQITPAMQQVLPLSERTASIRTAYAPRWKWGEPPSCLRVLSWKRDPVWLSDNSEEVFGRALSSLDDDGRAMAAGFAKECLPVLEAALLANKLKAPAAQAIVDDIAAAAEREGEAAREGADDLAPTLRVSHDGKTVPLSYLGQNSRKMVEVANNAEKAARKLTTEEMIMLSKWAERVVMDGHDGPERLYADAVRTVISNHLFKSR